MFRNKDLSFFFVSLCYVFSFFTLFFSRFKLVVEAKDRYNTTKKTHSGVLTKYIFLALCIFDLNSKKAITRKNVFYYFLIANITT